MPPFELAPIEQCVNTNAMKIPLLLFWLLVKHIYTEITEWAMHQGWNANKEMNSSICNGQRATTICRLLTQALIVKFNKPYPTDRNFTKLQLIGAHTPIFLSCVMEILAEL